MLHLKCFPPATSQTSSAMNLSLSALSTFSFISNHFCAQKKSKRISPNDIIYVHSLELEHNKLVGPAFYDGKVRFFHWNFIHSYTHLYSLAISAFDSIQFVLIYKFKYIETWMGREFFSRFPQYWFCCESASITLSILFSLENRFLPKIVILVNECYRILHIYTVQRMYCIPFEHSFTMNWNSVKHALSSKELTQKYLPHIIFRMHA